MIAVANRREFITLVGGAAATWPIAARSQQTGVPVIGLLSSLESTDSNIVKSAFHEGLSGLGFVEGRNVAIEYRWAEGEYDRLQMLATDLVQRQVAVIVTAGGSVSGLAAKKATASIPIVFTSGDDPVKVGLVTSLNHPGGNVTGVYVIIGALDAKKLGLLRETAPSTAVIAVLENGRSPAIQDRVSTLEKAAGAIGQQVQLFYASDERTIETTFARMSQSGVGALVVGADPFFNSRRDQIVALAAQYAIPAIYETRDYVTAGGLMSYGTDLSEGYRQVGPRATTWWKTAW